MGFPDSTPNAIGGFFERESITCLLRLTSIHIDVGNLVRRKFIKTGICDFYIESILAAPDYAALLGVRLPAIVIRQANIIAT